MSTVDFQRFTDSRASETVDFIPPGYVVGRTKFIGITGGVMSGVGKGVFAGSVCCLLSSCGLAVAPVKLEGYLNLDSGTINPERHGEVFVLDDGTECDLDLGSYERFLDRDLSRDNFYTAGKLMMLLLDRERHGDFLGRDLQIVPHLTGELKYLLRKVAMQQKLDIVLVEVGGTVGDLESATYLEALRELALEEGRENVMFCHVTPILTDRKSEQKTKPTQHSVRQLLEAGIQPDVIVLRSEVEALPATREKVALFCNVPVGHVISSIDTPSIYTVPNALKEQRLLSVVAETLHLTIDDAAAQTPLSQYVRFCQSPSADEITIGVCGKYSHGTDSYLSIAKALEHCEPALDLQVHLRWINAEDFESRPYTVRDTLAELDGLIVPGGFGRRGIEGMIAAIQEARRSKLPFLGICLGCQLALIEMARHECGLEGANSTEFDRNCQNPVVSLLAEQKHLSTVGANMRLGGARVVLTVPSKAFVVYGTAEVRERFRHRYEFDRRYEARLRERGLRVVGTTETGEIAQVIELEDHPFFIGTQYHPELTSRPLRPHPLFLHLCRQAARHRARDERGTTPAEVPVLTS